MNDNDKYHRDQILNNWKNYLAKVSKKPRFHILTGILYIAVISLAGYLYQETGIYLVSGIMVVVLHFNAYLVYDKKLQTKLRIWGFYIRIYIRKFIGFNKNEK